MVNKTSNQVQVSPNLQAKIGTDPISRPDIQAEKPVKNAQIQDGQTSQSVRIGASVAPTAEQSALKQGGVLQAQISGMKKTRGTGGKRTSKLKVPEGAQLLRGMKNSQAMQNVLSLQGRLHELLG